MTITTRKQFLKAKKQQQIHLWQTGKITTASLVDWVLAYGEDRDLEWLSANFDPLETIDA